MDKQLHRQFSVGAFPPFLNFRGSLFKPLLKLGHQWVIRPHNFIREGSDIIVHQDPSTCQTWLEKNLKLYFGQIKTSWNMAFIRCEWAYAFCVFFFRKCHDQVWKLTDKVDCLGEWHWKHDDVIKWKHFPRYWPFVRGIHRSPVNSPHKGQWRGALMFSLICVWINSWVNNGEAGDLRRFETISCSLWRYRAHYDVLIMTGSFHVYRHNDNRRCQQWR